MIRLMSGIAAKIQNDKSAITVPASIIAAAVAMSLMVSSNNKAIDKLSVKFDDQVKIQATLTTDIALIRAENQVQTDDIHEMRRAIQKLIDALVEIQTSQSLIPKGTSIKGIGDTPLCVKTLDL